MHDPKHDIRTKQGLRDHLDLVHHQGVDVWRIYQLLQLSVYAEFDTHTMFHRFIHALTDTKSHEGR